MPNGIIMIYNILDIHLTFIFIYYMYFQLYNSRTVHYNTIEYRL